MLAYLYFIIFLYTYNILGWADALADPVLRTSRTRPAAYARPRTTSIIRITTGMNTCP